MKYLLYAGVVLAILGLVGLGICMKIVLDLKKQNLPAEEMQNRMGTVIALNTASLGTGFIGLALVVVAVLTAP